MNRLALAMGLFGWLLTGCGDDDGATPGDASTDAIALDAQPDLGRDAGRDMGGTRDMGSRDTGTRDMAMPPDDDTGPPPPPADAGPDPDEMRGCDPLDDPCPSGSKCTVVIDVDAMDVQTVYTRCTEDGTRMVGGRCNFDMSEPTPDGTRTFTDNCARGAFCNTLPGRRFPI
ncbi:MAG: hypothetical protein IT379_08195, partial [Deltaproteobacteria bacterium]|nr:hypothetical protein [Deltaproteobacteria bacterium]